MVYASSPLNVHAIVLLLNLYFTENRYSILKQIHSSEELIIKVGYIVYVTLYSNFMIQYAVSVITLKAYQNVVMFFAY